MATRVTFFFQYQGDRLAGWSENYWNILTDQSAIATAAFLLGTQLSISKAYGVLWTRTRFSIPGQPRNSITVINNPAVSSGPPTQTGSFVADYQVTKWLIRLACAKFPVNQPGQNYSQQWFGGVTDASVVGAYIQPGVVISNLFPRVIAQLTAATNGWAVYLLNPAFPPNPILSINPATGVVTCANAISFGTATQIRVSRVQGLTYANRLWTWQPVTGQNNQVQLLNWVTQTQPMTVSPKANVRPQLYLGQTIVSVSAVRSSNHRVGRPTGQFGGRRRRSTVH